DPQKSEIYWCNEAAQRLFGRLDLVGSKLETLMPESIAERHAGIIAGYVDRYAAEFKKTGQPTDSRLLDVVPPRRLPVVRKVNGRDQIIHVDAWVRSLRVNGEPLDQPPRLMCLEAVEAEQAHIDTQEARIFKAALMHVGDGIVMADYNGRIEWVNRAMEKLCGYPLAAIRAVRGTVNLFLPDNITPQMHEGYLQHFRNTRQTAAATLRAESQAVVVQRRVFMKTALPPFKEEILLRVEVAYDKLIAFIKSTAEFIPRDEFENERLKLLLPASVCKLLRGVDATLDITSHFWEFDDKTVFFTDLEGFSEWSKSRSAQQVHDRMQPMFSEFEQIIASFGGELVHRVGDAVLAVFGLNGEERHHARYAVACAAELQMWSIQNHFSIRIGVHSGQIGAGIYGSSKGRPGFDVWGPVVNAAKRLESTAWPGGVHITKKVVESLGHKMAGPIHQIVQPHRLEGCKGVPDQDTFMLPVRDDNGNSATGIALPEKFVQMINQQKGRYARWKIQSEETERRLAELQKAARQ
ncbi:MAG: PAS domain-containing protein, partial [Myxococcales bacterium]|nr:PAS domain-containing protein [Myxococcales bacterium]